MQFLTWIFSLLKNYRGRTNSRKLFARPDNQARNFNLGLNFLLHQPFILPILPSQQKKIINCKSSARLSWMMSPLVEQKPNFCDYTPAASKIRNFQPKTDGNTKSRDFLGRMPSKWKMEMKWTEPFLEDTFPYIHAELPNNPFLTFALRKLEKWHKFLGPSNKCPEETDFETVSQCMWKS